MANQPQSRTFEINPRNAATPPLLLGFMGPPGGGKTKSALRVADGICRVRGGKPFVVDTEAGRALRYHRDHGGAHDFDFTQFTPPFIPAHFMDAIKQGVAHGAGCIIVDSASDEHEGEGGVLDWHDAVVPQMGGNEWAAWSKPKASRRVLISGIQQIRVPVILTFRAREKTVTKPVRQRNGNMKDQPVNIGFQPIAPMEIVHTLDLTCLLPPRANGVPLWESPKEGEDFVIKLPEFLAPFITRGAPLDERLGEALAHWQAGTKGTGASANGKRTPEEMVDAYVAGINSCETRGDLLEYQSLPARVDWLAKLAKSRADLHDRVIAANSHRLGVIESAENASLDDDRTPANGAPPGDDWPDRNKDDDTREGSLFGGESND